MSQPESAEHQNVCWLLTGNPGLMAEDKNRSQGNLLMIVREESGKGVNSSVLIEIVRLEV